MAEIRRTFKKGGSIAIVLPGKFKPRVNIHMTIKKDGKKFIVEPLIK